MRQHVSGLMLALVLGAFGVAHAAPATYTLYELVDGANHLNGTLTIDDADANHQIVQSEITGWNFVATGPVAFTLSSASGSVSCFGPQAGIPCLTVVGNELVFDFDSTVIQGPRIDFALAGLNTAHVQFLNGGANAGGAQCGPVVFVDCGQVQWFNPVLGVVDRRSGAIAVLAAPVPEPTTFGLMALGLASVFGLAAVRRQRIAGPRRPA